MKKKSFALLTLFAGLFAVTSCGDDPEEFVNKTIEVNGVSFEMIAVEGGTFTMGATDEQGKDAFINEMPAHSVKLSDFYIGKTEVTQALWKAVMDGENPSRIKGDNLPVDKVSWNDCKTFISKLNKLTGKRFRMPTEAEWEYAARGGKYSMGYKYSGSNDINAVAWYANNSDYECYPVGTKKANELGLYDMSGNVSERCQDWFEYYSSSSEVNPTGPSSGTYRIYRGGNYGQNATYCRVSCREYDIPESEMFLIGLRLAMPK